MTTAKKDRDLLKLQVVRYKDVWPRKGTYYRASLGDVMVWDAESREEALDRLEEIIRWRKANLGNRCNIFVQDADNTVYSIHPGMDRWEVTIMGPKRASSYWAYPATREFQELIDEIVNHIRTSYWTEPVVRTF